MHIRLTIEEFEKEGGSIENIDLQSTIVRCIYSARHATFLKRASKIEFNEHLNRSGEKVYKVTFEDGSEYDYHPKFLVGDFDVVLDKKFIANGYKTELV